MEQKNTPWNRLAYFITNVISPLLAGTALYVAWVALGLANKTYTEGASLIEQQKQIKQLSDLYETQLRTNRSLQNGLDSQSRQIHELKNIYLVGSGQFKISKKSLALVIEDRSQTDKLDKNAFSMGIISALFSFNDFIPFTLPPHDASEPLGEQYDAKINSIKLLINSLTTSRYVLSRKYQFENLISLITFMEITHTMFQLYHHSYPPVDFMIEKDFLRMGPYLRISDSNDSSTSTMIKYGLDLSAQLMSHHADSVFKEGHYAP